MNEVIIVTHNGDHLDDLIKTAMEVVKIKTVSYALIEFNEVRIFIKKDTTKESASIEYSKKLKQLYS